MGLSSPPAESVACVARARSCAPMSVGGPAAVSCLADSPPDSVLCAPPQTLCEAAFLAARTGDVERLRTLLRDTPSLAAQHDPSERTPLMWASMLGHVDCVRLLAPLSPLQDLDIHGSTALGLAARHGQADCLALLLPLSQLSVEQANQLLLLAAVADDPRSLEVLLSFGDPNAFTVVPGPIRYTVLAKAIVSHARSACTLLPFCDPQLGCDNGLTSLMLAAERDLSGQVVRALLPRLPSSAMSQTHPETGDTALFRALRASNLAAIRLLLPLSDVLTRNRDGHDAHELVWHLFEASQCLDDEYLQSWNLLAPFLPIEPVLTTLRYLQKIHPGFLSIVPQAVAFAERHALCESLLASPPAVDPITGFNTPSPETNGSLGNTAGLAPCCSPTPTGRPAASRSRL